MEGVLQTHTYHSKLTVTGPAAIAARSSSARPGSAIAPKAWPAMLKCVYFVGEPRDPLPAHRVVGSRHESVTVTVTPCGEQAGCPLQITCAFYRVMST